MLKRLKDIIKGNDPDEVYCEGLITNADVYHPYNAGKEICWFYCTEIATHNTVMLELNPQFGKTVFWGHGYRKKDIACLCDICHKSKHTLERFDAYLPSWRLLNWRLKHSRRGV